MKRSTDTAFTLTQPAPEMLHAYVLAAEHATLPMAVLEAPGMRFLHANRPFCRLYGVSAETLEHGAVDLLPAPQRLRRLLEGVAQSGIPETLATVDISPSAGIAAQGALTALPLLDAAGRIVGLLLHVHDLHPSGQAPHDAGGASPELLEANQRLLLASLREQELAERAEQSAAELRALMENMTEGVAAFDAGGRVILTNPVGRALLGLEGEPRVAEDFGRLCLRRLDGSPIDFMKDLLARALVGASFSEEEFVLHGEDGGQSHLIFGGSASKDDAGQIRCALLLFRDITEMRSLEEVRRKYVALLSHDLRGPLLAAKLSGEMLARDTSQPARSKTSAARIVQSLTQLESMVNQLLDAERLRPGPGSAMERVECDLVVLARDLTEELALQYGRRIILAGEAALVGKFSVQQVRRALWNLTSNALKYGDENAPVRVLLERLPGGARISVHNEGSAIPPEEQTTLFRPYVRTRTAVASGKPGLGLGLAQVEECARLHGGRVSVRSSEGEGTTFQFELLELGGASERQA